MRKYGSTSREQLTDAVFAIAGAKGLDAASIREVASAAEVSIGAVQHHFTTKDELYAFAFEQLTARVRARMGDIDPGAPLADRLITALSQLLPLDAVREHEARVMVSFAARAATSGTLAEIQRRTLTEIRHELEEQLTAANLPNPATRAALLLAAVDGLALDAVSAGIYSPDDLTAALSLQVRALLTRS
ncbi:TetR/AcrR family transcriptional regulator [Nocardia concava]|uniref:TetR/AcrR family transcriptional regulator n=1 Tax=Nocardia concava TaxID=257281 RepID=UPI001FE04E5D|nr:TetR/AcrR family transcriptional regulator [Nocardia concava]